MLTDKVETRLKNEVSSLRLVSDAAGFAALNQDGKLLIPPKTPASYVIELAARPGPNQRTTAHAGAMQEVFYHIVVITVARVANDRDGSKTGAVMSEVRQQIKDALFGWTPPEFLVSFELGPSALYDFAGGAHWHQDEFITSRHETPGGNP